MVQETKRMMDTELFLEGQTKWEEDSPHQLVMLYEMLSMPLTKGRRKQSEPSTEAASRGYQSWTQRQTYLPFSS